MFFRLNVLQIALPPLRERKQDIPVLAGPFIERFCVNEGAIPKDISEATEKQLINYDWPGNVRQLENVINRAMVVSDGNVLNVENLSGLVSETETPSASSKTSRNIRIISDDGDFKSINEIEQEAMQIALDHFDHNITQAAKVLGMAKSTFYKKMKNVQNN